jgi:hypothetical protein
VLSEGLDLKVLNDGLVVNDHHLARLGHGGLPLDSDFHAIGLGLLAQPAGLLDTVLQVLLAAGLAYVLNTHVEPLQNLPVAHHLGHLYTHGPPGHVEDTSSAAVVEVVGHTLVDRGVHHDGHKVTPLVGGQVGGGVGHAVGPETLAVLAPSVPAETVGVGHFKKI